MLAACDCILMAACTACMKSLLGLGCVLIRLMLVALMTGFYTSVTRFYLVMTCGAFSDAETCMLCMCKSYNAKLGVELDDSFIIRDG